MTSSKVKPSANATCTLLTVLDGDFDDADFGIGDPDSHPDEVVLPAPAAKSHHFNSGRSVSGPASNGTTSNQSRPPVNRQQPNRPSNGPPSTNPPPQPQTPNSGFARSTSAAGSGMQMRPPQPPQDSGPARPIPAPPVVAGRVLNQPSRMGAGPSSNPPSNPGSPSKLNKSQEDDIPDPGMPPPGTGFFSARAAAMVPEGAATEPLPPNVHNLPVFNPRAESPSIRKTPGIDFKGSRPITRDLKQLPGSSQAPAAGARPTNIVNPQLDSTRRIGAPGSPSPNANRGHYKPPTMKRPMDGTGGGLARAPLHDLPANGTLGNAGDVGGDLKRQRMSN